MNVLSVSSSPLHALVIITEIRQIKSHYKLQPSMTSEMFVSHNSDMCKSTSILLIETRFVLCWTQNFHSVTVRQLPWDMETVSSYLINIDMTLSWCLKNCLSEAGQQVCFFEEFCRHLIFVTGKLEFFQHKKIRKGSVGNLAKHTDPTACREGTSVTDTNISNTRKLW